MRDEDEIRDYSKEMATPVARKGMKSKSAPVNWDKRCREENAKSPLKVTYPDGEVWVGPDEDWPKELYRKAKLLGYSPVSGKPWKDIHKQLAAEAGIEDDED